MRRLLIIFLLTTLPAGAQFAHISHYVKTHKELLVSDALTIAALSADAASSVHCQSIRPVPCIEDNSILGHHPSQLATWGLLLGFGMAEVTGEHVVVHLANIDPDNYGYMRHFIWIPTTFIVGTEGPNIWNNVCVAEHDQAANRLAIARARLAQ